MRISDWSSDVCSSDLNGVARDFIIVEEQGAFGGQPACCADSALPGTREELHRARALLFPTCSPCRAGALPVRLFGPKGCDRLPRIAHPAADAGSRQPRPKRFCTGRGPCPEFDDRLSVPPRLRAAAPPPRGSP